MEETVIAIGDPCPVAEGGGECGRESVRMELPVWGEAVCFRAVLAAPRARLSDLVPLARAAATKVALSVLRQLAACDVSVPCGKGCSACCRYLIPLAPPEAFRLAEELRQLPPQRRAGLESSFRQAERRIRSAAPPRLSTRRNGSDRSPAGEMAKLGRWCDDLALDCPLLEDNLCACYDWRPASCRSYIVRSPAEYCSPPLTSLGARVGMPVSITRALCEVTSRLEGQPAQAVLLPVAPSWAERNWLRARRSWPAAEMIQLFAAILQNQAAAGESSSAAGESSSAAAESSSAA